MCLTFARPKQLLEEAVYSFLMQDYPGDKELLILNDFGPQVLRFEHPQVTVINVPARFHTLGEKRNAAAALCRYDLLAVWDDDDINLPHRLSFSVEMYDERKRFFKTPQIFFVNHGGISGHFKMSGHGTAMWHRSLFDEVGGFKHMGSGEDQDIEARFDKVIGGGKNHEAITLSEIFYLYRWEGTGSYHISGYGTDESNASINTKIREAARHQLEEGIIHRGEVELRPHWSADYSELVRRYIATPLMKPRWVQDELLPDGRLILYNARTEQTMTLNPTAALVWECCDGAQSRAKIVEEVRELFPGKYWIERDVLTLLAQLIASDMVSDPDLRGNHDVPAGMTHR